MKIGENIFGLLIQEEHQDGSEGTGNGGAANEGGAGEGEAATSEGGEPAGGEAPTVIPAPTDDFEERFQARVFEMAKTNGREITAMDELFKAPEPQKIEVNPYENVDPKVKGFLDYHKDTNRSYEDYQALQKDVAAIPDIELARDRVRQETGKNFSNDEVDSYLEKKLNIDLSDLSDLDIADQIELTSFAKSARENKLIEQEKYKQPIDTKPATAPLGNDMVELENGERMPKSVYEGLVAQRQKYVESINKSMDSIVPTVFNVVVDDNGSEKTINYSYDYSKEDVQNMASKANDLEVTINSYKDEQGNFKQLELMEDLYWMDKNNRGKALSAIIHKVRAEVTEELLKQEGNVNLGQGQSRSNIPGARKGNNDLSLRGTGFGVKFDFKP
jgi:ketosteroid isomerase-like protein